MAVKNRWQRRRELRQLAPRLALVTVSAWKSRSYSPDDIAEPLPHDYRARGWDEPGFWFLDDGAYDLEMGLCPDARPSCRLL
jgi:hypothetical protein